MGISFLSPLPFTSLLFSAICKASSDSHFVVLHFLGMVLITASCTMSQTSIHISSGTLSDLISWICLSLPLLVAHLCPTLCDPMGCSPPGSSVHGILQARILEWVAMPFSRESSRPRYQTFVSCIAGRFCTIWATNEALKSVIWPCICPVLFIYNTLFSIWQKLIILWLLHTCMKNEFRYSDEQKVFLGGSHSTCDGHINRIHTLIICRNR